MKIVCLFAKKEMKITPSGKESFDHLTGGHNNIRIALELSTHRRIQLGLRLICQGIACDNKNWY